MDIKKEAAAVLYLVGDTGVNFGWPRAVSSAAYALGNRLFPLGELDASLRQDMSNEHGIS